MPQKKYIVRLTAQEREICQQTVRKLNGSSEKVRRAQILLKADADGPGWTDQQIADAAGVWRANVLNHRTGANGVICARHVVLALAARGESPRCIRAAMHPA